MAYTYLIWSNQRSMWWRPNRVGYTEFIEEAGRYSYYDASAIVASATCGGQLKRDRTDPVTGEAYTSYDDVMVPAPGPRLASQTEQVTRPDLLISIDAECNGLAGRAFCVAMTLSDRSGELEHVVYRCPIDEPADEWVAANVLPAIEDVEINCNDYAGMLRNLREDRFLWAEDGEAVTIGHVIWPVEARLLLDMYPGDDIWRGPYPLLDVASVLMAEGHNPVSVDDYLTANRVSVPEGSPHHPLYDARAAERCLRHLLEGGR